MYAISTFPFAQRQLPPLVIEPDKHFLARFVPNA